MRLKIAQAIQQVQVQSTSMKETAEANLKLEINTDFRMLQIENITGYINMSENLIRNLPGYYVIVILFQKHC